MAKDPVPDVFVMQASDFLTEYLPEMGVDNILDGIECIKGFLVRYDALARTYAQSIRLFYRCMLINGEINRGEYASVFDILTSYGIFPLIRDGEDMAALTEISVFQS